MKQVFILSVFIAMVLNAHAQLSYGGRASLTFAKFRFSNSHTIPDYKPVVFGGVFANYKLTTKFSVQLDALGFIETSKIKNFKTGVTSANRNLILRMPLVIQYAVSKRVRVGTGPQIGFAVKNDSKPADWKWAMVAGYQVPGLKGIAVSTKYSFTMSKITDMRSGVLQFGIGYSIIRKKGKV